MYFIAGTVAGAVAFFAVLSKTGKFCGKIFEKKKLENTEKELINRGKKDTIICITWNNLNLR